jgi:hypothetical protein
MSRRPYCLGPHAWSEHQHRGTTELQCSKCPATFPCRESCAHTDCEEHTGRTAACPVCQKPVSYLDGFHFTIYSKLVRVCAATCVEAYESRHQPEPEDAQQEAAA